jgi:hypothetical protein
VGYHDDAQVYLVNRVAGVPGDLEVETQGVDRLLADAHRRQHDPVVYQVVQQTEQLVNRPVREPPVILQHLNALREKVLVHFGRDDLLRISLLADVLRVGQE